MSRNKNVSVEERKKQMLNYSRALYQERKSHGICTNCGMEAAIAGQILCEQCREIRNLKRRKNENGAQKRPRRVFAEPRDRKKEKAQYAKERRDEFRKKGMCTRCGKYESLPGLKICSSCRLSMNQARNGYFEHSQKWYKKERKAGRL